MGRIRTIKPEFHSHEELSSLPPETHLLAAALTNYADDEGYFNANPVLVKAGTNPLRKDKTTIEDMMQQLESIGYLEIRKSGLKHYGRICTFEEHQRVSHPAPSKLKSKFESLPKSSGEAPEKLQSDSVLKGIEGNGTGNGNEVSKTSSSHPGASLGAVTKHPDFAIYEAYPRKEGKGAAMEAIRKAVARLMKGEEPHAPMAKIEAQRHLMRRVLEYERSPVGRQPDKTKIPHPATWFNQKRYDDDQANWQLVNGASNGTTQGNNKPNAAIDRQRISHDAIIEAGRRRYGVGTAEDDGRGSGGEAEPDATSGDAGCVPPGVGGDSSEIRLDDFQGRTLEGTP